MQQITKQFGEGAIMHMDSDKINDKIPVISTGSISLDLALGVGEFFPKVALSKSMVQRLQVKPQSVSMLSPKPKSGVVPPPLSMQSTP
jgi:hypothetical protein